MTTSTYTEIHNTYGGEVYNSDFGTSHSPGNMAKRIARNLKFDEQCKINAIARDKMKKGLK